jgi:RimJ/RimL family protein N-acetyltransferase/2-polyprenyl-3-methyl-5-hydroxy-6-metoxy-1,4-benzoquinol methylase
MNLPIIAHRLYIAKFDETMAASVQANSLDEDNRRFIPDEVFETVEDARKAVSALIAFYAQKDAPQVYPVILRDGRHIGHVQAYPIKNGWEIGYHVTKPFTGNGYATEAVSAFLPHIMEKLGLTQIFALCHAENRASRRVLTKCGFSLAYEGMGAYHGKEEFICRYEYRPSKLEKMDAFFNARAEIYDSHMLGDLKLEGFYKAVTACFDTPVNHLLDLGCGTGLELVGLFEKYPHMQVTGVDVSSIMLEQLRAKFPGRSLRFICDSYLEVDFGGSFDGVLSTYSLHHFSEKEKLALYRKIHAALQGEGIFVFGDYTVSTIEGQQEALDASRRKRQEQGVAEGECYHLDIPLTPETELRLIRAAGFDETQIVRQWENASLIIARKSGDGYYVGS